MYSGHVLVAEDNPSNQMLIQLLLKKLGFETTMADDGQIAVDIYDSKPFKIILMDMMMPNMNGYEATQTLRKRGVTTPIVAVTANAMKGDREKCLEAGCDEYISKPITKDSLEKVISLFVKPDNQGDVDMSDDGVAKINQDAGPIISDLASDPDLYIVAEMFVDRLGEIIGNVKQALASEDSKALKDLFHEIKGAGGSAGFQILTDKSAAIEKLILDDNKEERNAAIEEFFKICDRVQATAEVA